MMFLLKGEIAYGSCTINEALANISTRCGMNIDNILENIASDTEGNFMKTGNRSGMMVFKYAPFKKYKSGHP